MPKAAPKKKAANGYKPAEPLPTGEVLEDVVKKKWKLGPSIAHGGFGEIYSAQEVGGSGAKYSHVVKIEPHQNGPLFVEMHFYIKNARPEDVEDFKNQKGLKTFGMPLYLGSGSHEFNSEKYRFIVMEKFGQDLWTIFLESDRHFPSTTVFKIAVQILDVLEYIHSKGYVHADVKGANLLLGITKDTQNKQVYLVDFGLAARCNEEDEFKPNPKKAHDGTIEYLSRDAHNGVQTKRGDLETLAYNLIQWLGCVLPWEKNLKDPNAVQKVKEEFMSSVPKFIKACFDKRSPPGPIVDFLNCLSTLEHNSNPDYKTIRKIFLSGLSPGDALGKPFQFSVPDKSPKSKSPVKRKNEDKLSPSKRKLAKIDIEEEPSEDEKENFDDLSDMEEETKKIVKSKGKNIKPKGKKKPGGSKKSKKEVPEEVANEMMDEDKTDIEDGQTSDKKELIESPKKIRKRAADHLETKEKQKPKGRKKAAKEINGKDTELCEDPNTDADQPTVPDVAPPVRSTRQRGRLVNYKEDSDDEKVTTKRKPKNPPSSKDVHVTGDSGNEEYTQVMKQVRKKVQNNKSKKKAEHKNKETVVVEKESDIIEEMDSDNSKGDDEEVTKVSRARKNRTVDDNLES